MKQKAVCVGSARGGEGLSVAPGFSGSSIWRKEGGLTHLLGRSLTNVRILPLKNIQLIFQEESRIITKFAIHDRTRTHRQRYWSSLEESGM